MPAGNSTSLRTIVVLAFLFLSDRKLCRFTGTPEWSLPSVLYLPKEFAGKVQQIYSDKFFILVTSVEKAKNVVLRLRNRFFRATIDEQVCLFDFYERIKSGGKSIGDGPTKQNGDATDF